MDSIDRKIISLMGKSQIDTPLSISEALEKYIEFLSRVSGIDFENMDEENDNPFEYKIVNVCVADTLKKAIIAIMTRSNTEEKDEIMTHILSMSIKEISREFIEHTDFARRILSAYFSYLKLKSIGQINTKLEHTLEEKNLWFKNLNTYKGFYTINDMARSVLDSICALALDLEATDEQLGNLFDGYFYTSTFDQFIKSDAPMYAKNKETISIFKLYQMRLIIADAYTRESSSYIMEEKEETGILEDLEDLIERQDFRLPKSKRLRYLIYKSFYRGYTLNELDYLYNILGSEDKIETLRPINPLYFLD